MIVMLLVCGRRNDGYVLTSHFHWRMSLCGFGVPHLVILLLLLLLMLLLLILMTSWRIEVLTDILMFLQFCYLSFRCMQIKLILLKKLLLCRICLFKICSILLKTIHLTIYFGKTMNWSCSWSLGLSFLLLLHSSRKLLVRCFLLPLPSPHAFCIVYQQLIELQHIRRRRRRVWRRRCEFSFEDHFRRRRGNDGRRRLLMMRNGLRLRWRLSLSSFSLSFPGLHTRYTLLHMSLRWLLMLRFGRYLRMMMRDRDMLWLLLRRQGRMHRRHILQLHCITCLYFTLKLLGRNPFEVSCSCRLFLFQLVESQTHLLILLLFFR